MTTQPAEQSERHCWWKRPLPVVLVLLAVIFVLYLMPSTTHYSRTAQRCSRCYLNFTHFKLELLGFEVINRYRPYYRGTPELKTAQAKCTHPVTGGGNRSGSLSPLGMRRGGHSRANYGTAPLFVNALDVEGAAAIMPTMFEPHILDMWRNATATHDEPPLARWAWFMQQVTGEDFGIIYDDKADVPVLPDDTIDRINAWWRDHGQARYTAE